MADLLWWVRFSLSLSGPWILWCCCGWHHSTTLCVSRWQGLWISRLWFYFPFSWRGAGECVQTSGVSQLYWVGPCQEEVSVSVSWNLRFWRNIVVFVLVMEHWSSSLFPQGSLKVYQGLPNKSTRVGQTRVNCRYWTSSLRVSCGSSFWSMGYLSCCCEVSGPRTTVARAWSSLLRINRTFALCH